MRKCLLAFVINKHFSLAIVKRKAYKFTLWFGRMYDMSVGGGKTSQIPALFEEGTSVYFSDACRGEQHFGFKGNQLL